LPVRFFLRRWPGRVCMACSDRVNANAHKIYGDGDCDGIEQWCSIFDSIGVFTNYRSIWIFGDVFLLGGMYSDLLYYGGILHA